MTENKRIAVNVLASYGRSLLALICGLLTSRWILMALGQSDYGLFGVVGGLMVFITLLNTVLASALARFYAYSVGKARAEKSADALEECRKWFNTAVSIHWIVPAVLVAIGYPIGIWAVRHFLTIPVDRIENCVWVFRFTCLASFVGMVNVPFSAMFTAKQDIAERTLYSTIALIANFLFVGYMAFHPSDWFVRYSLFCCLVSVTPQIVLCIRACIRYPECRLVGRYMFLGSYLRQIGSFTAWKILGNLCNILRSQGIAILINKAFGPKVNASMTVARKVEHQTSTLAGALIGAFAPAITNAYGAKDFRRMRALAYRAGKFGVLLCLLFALPISVEIKEIVRLWLKNPPPYTAGLCLCMIAYHLTEVSTTGHLTAINAHGRIREYQMVLSAISIFTLPVAGLFLWLGFGPYSVGITLVFMIGLNSLGRVWFARKLAGLSAIHWLKWSILPLLATLFVAALAGLSPRLFLSPGPIRFLFAAACCEAALLPMAWFAVLDGEERAYISRRARSTFRKFLPSNREATQ